MMGQGAAPAGVVRRPALGRRRGTRKQVYAVCANANCYAGGTTRPPARSWLTADRSRLSGSSAKRGPALEDVAMARRKAPCTGNRART